MELAFEKSDIVRWARFSGDYNPIHFDRDAALRAGSPEIIVHGMLAVLPIKAALSREAKKVICPSDWWKFTSRFKRPVPMTQKLFLTLGLKGQGNGYSFGGGATPYILGAMTQSSEPQCPGGGWHESQMSSLELGKRISEFSTAFPEVSEFWVVLDSIIFSHFLNSMLAAIIRDCSLQLDVSCGLSGLGETLVMQTRHAVTFNSSRLAGSSDHPLTCHACLGEILTLPNGVAGTVVVSSFVGAHLIMSMEIGLMMTQARRLPTSVCS